MWFLWEDPDVWMETGANFANAAILRRNPHAAIVIDESDGGLGLRAVVMRGRVDIVSAPGDVAAMVERIYVKYLGRDALATEPVRAMLGGEHVLLRFTPTFERAWDTVEAPTTDGEADAPDG